MKSSDQSVRDKLGLLRLARKLGNVTEACNSLGYSRDSYYRFRTLYERGGQDALRNLSRRKPLCKNRVVQPVEEAVVASAFAHPAWGQERTARELDRRGIRVSSSGVRSIWQRHDLETAAKRAVAIRIRASRERLPLSVEQREALARAATSAMGRKARIPMSPGEVCYQNFSAVGETPELGRIFQHVLVDGYSWYAFVRIEQEASGISPAAFLASHVMPWFRERLLPMETVRTDRRAPFAGADGEGYRLMLDRAGISLTHRLVSARSGEDPCAVFERIIDTEFYQKIFRVGLGDDFVELQTRLGHWLETYNEIRPETRAACYGEAPAGAVGRYLKARNPDPDA